MLENPKEYIKLWLSYESYFKEYNDEEVGRLVRAMFEYRTSGKAPEFPGNERFIWPVIQREIDEGAASQREASKRNRANGCKGGRPKKETVPEARKESQPPFSENGNSDSVPDEGEKCGCITEESEKCGSIPEDSNTDGCISEESEKHANAFSESEEGSPVLEESEKTDRFFEKPKKAKEKEKEKEMEKDKVKEKGAPSSSLPPPPDLVMQAAGGTISPYPAEVKVLGDYFEGNFNVRRSMPLINAITNSLLDGASVELIRAVIDDAALAHARQPDLYVKKILEDLLREKVRDLSAYHARSEEFKKRKGRKRDADSGGNPDTAAGWEPPGGVHY